MRRLLLVWLSAFIAITELWSQSQDEQKLKLSGTVVNSATGEPVHGALVQLYGSQSRSVMAGSDGHFEVAGLPAGALTITAQRPGFDPQGAQRQLNLNADTGSITIKLVPLARISGQIVDREGEPIDGVAVQCTRQIIANGRRQWQQQQGAVTDQSGHFALEDLMSGSYIVSTVETQLYMSAQPKSEAARFIYPQTFYPDALSRDSAQAIRVSPGEESRVDFALHSMRGTRVTFTTDPPYQNVMATLGDGEEQFGGRGSRMNPKGGITFPAVPPGTWKITVRGPFSEGHNQNNEPLYGELPIQVASADLENLIVPMGKLPDIPVLVAGDTNAGITLQLMSEKGQGYGSQDQSGALQFHAVQPGTYRVVWQPQDVCLTSLISGPLDLLRNELVVNAGARVPPITVEKGEHCGSLNVTSQSGLPGIAIVTSDSKAFEPRVYSFAASGFHITGLPEGEYSVYAFDEMDNLEYSNPDAMRDFKAQTIKLAAGENAALQIVEVNQRRPQ